MFETILSFVYYLVALFYLAYGALLLVTPHVVVAHIPRFFPLLASFRYHTLATSLNLIGAGAMLLIVGEFINNLSVEAIFVALLLSGLEVYLGIKFYYLEEHDIPQAITHVTLHLFIVIAVGWLLLTEYEPAIRTLEIEALTIFGVY